MFKILIILQILFITSCGIYNLELSLKNPLDGINIFSLFSKKTTATSLQYQCKIEINNENWNKAVEICGDLSRTNVNISLYASALHGRNGGDIFNLKDAAMDKNDEYETIIDGYANFLGETNTSSISDLTEAISLLGTITYKTPGNYFQLAFIHFTLACSYISKAATDNGNSDGPITADDIEYMTLSDLDAFYDNMTECLDNLTLAGSDGSIFEDVTNTISDIGVWPVGSEATKETIVKTLFGL